MTNGFKNYTGLLDEVDRLEILIHLLGYVNLDDLLSKNPVLEQLSKTFKLSRPKNEAEFKLTGSVGVMDNGKIGKNDPDDIRKVMDRMHELELISTEHYYYEYKSTLEKEGQVLPEEIPNTIRAIKGFQQKLFSTTDGMIETEGKAITYRYMRFISSTYELKLAQNLYPNGHTIS